MNEKQQGPEIPAQPDGARMFEHEVNEDYFAPKVVGAKGNTLNPTFEYKEGELPKLIEVAMPGNYSIVDNTEPETVGGEISHAGEPYEFTVTLLVHGGTEIPSLPFKYVEYQSVIRQVNRLITGYRLIRWVNDDSEVVVLKPMSIHGYVVEVCDETGEVILPQLLNKGVQDVPTGPHSE